MKTLYTLMLAAAIVALAGCPQPDSPTTPNPDSPGAPATGTPTTATDTKAGPPGGSPAASNMNQHWTPPLASATLMNDNVAATLEQNSIAAIQTSSTRVVIDFNYRLTGSLALTRFEAGLNMSDTHIDGKIKIELDGVVISETALAGLRNGTLIVNLTPALLVTGTHRFRVLVESDHGTGDMLQGEVRRIVTDKTDHNVVFRWASVLCG